MKNTQFQTKEDYQKAVVELCKPLKKYYSEEKAYLQLGETSAAYDRKTIGIEGFARPLWGLMPLFAGGGVSDLFPIYTEGFKNGTNPEHPEYWGEITDFHQAYVEMAAMGLGLLLAPEVIWDPLTEAEKENINNWLWQINEHVYPENNWQFFRVLVNIGLRKVGARYSQEAIDRSLALVETFYLGDGWYMDGKTQQKDYYIAFAIHFYSLIYAKEMKEVDPERSNLFIERAKLFAKDFMYWFSENGEALPFGRSLTYRFAQCSFFSALAFAEVEALPWGVIKGIVNRHFRVWCEKPIFDREGILTIGYNYPNILMAEGYNAPGSPYWAFKSFLVLALPDEHPFWQAQEEDLPELESMKVIKHAQMIIQRPEKDHVIALTSGQYARFRPNHVAEKYAKFAYSNYFGFNVPRSYYLLNQAVPDNMLAFVRDNMYYVRRECEEIEVRENSIYSKWSPMAGIVVETVIKPYEKGHLRTHTIQAEFDIEAVECGFSIPDDTYPQKGKVCGENFSTFHNESGYSSIELRKGNGKGDVVACEANTNLVHPRTVLPYIHLVIQKGTTIIESYVVGLKNR